jgi:hypothetical protein
VLALFFIISTQITLVVRFIFPFFLI